VDPVTFKIYVCQDDLTTGNNAGILAFYDVCEKVAMMCGLIMFGTLDNLTGMRNSIMGLALVYYRFSLIDCRDRSDWYRVMLSEVLTQ
jgi:hypothetical protein